MTILSLIWVHKISDKEVLHRINQSPLSRILTQFYWRSWEHQAALLKTFGLLFGKNLQNTEAEQIHPTYMKPFASMELEQKWELISITKVPLCAVLAEKTSSFSLVLFQHTHNHSLATRGRCYPLLSASLISAIHRCSSIVFLWTLEHTTKIT